MAIFIVPIVNGSPDLAMEQLYYDNAGKLAGGYSCIGQVPNATTCLVRVYASDDQLDTLAEDDRYLFVEDVVEGVPEGVLMVTRAAKRQKKNKIQKIAYLKSKGHSSDKIDSDMAGDELTGLRKVHGVTEVEYEAGKQ